MGQALDFQLESTLKSRTYGQPFNKTQKVTTPAYRIEHLSRLLVTNAQGEHILPWALNDVLYCHQHPAATSRYEMRVIQTSQKPGNLKESVQMSEQHLSSGIWIATPAGSSAAIISYGQPVLPLHARTFLVSARELYGQKSTPRLSSFALNGATEALEVFSHMRHSLVCADGPDSCKELGFGSTIRLTLPHTGLLGLVVKNP